MPPAPTAVLGALVFSLLLLGSTARAQALPGIALIATKPDAIDKRCQVSKRRVTRQQEIVADVAARVGRQRKARDACSGKQACARIDHALKASEARKTRYDKDLARYEAEAANLCRAR